ncbi:MAG: DUF1499 domain-containing protein [Pseudomonadota bacterium]|uniref:DUF1499 domain-containing protein n=1 Tax=Alcanivorax sp. TaxID=1872427 RepID=UPI0024402953|nr:DUF1499 domain-containing protein [Alcanivorax sp.]MED5240289.1 DUF1499 domain-containing protein [Pseudomonadota bacterium]MEE3319445.1 DUF1499 domain-containing protein [Pseudomonadota bacterium]
MADENLLAPCPNSPNCVSSLSGSKDHWVAPLEVSDTRDTSLQRVQSVLDSLPRVDYDVVGPARINARFKSMVLRFTDDVTFYVRENGTVEVRSASRVGYWDLGANRRRVESLREKLAEMQSNDRSARLDNESAPPVG